MRVHRALITFVVAFFPGFAMQAHAQCAGFSDVSPFNNPFCTNVQWMKNRAITLGCGNGTTYCPTDPVSRLQMAAFMNRVGNVLTPRVLSVEASGGALNIIQQNFLCQTAVVPGVTYSREVHADASLSFDADAAGDLALALFSSLDGMTWGPGAMNDQVVVVTIEPGGRQHASVTLKRKDAPTLGGSSDAVQFALRVTRGGQNTNAQLTGWTCHLQAVVTTKPE